MLVATIAWNKMVSHRDTTMSEMILRE